MLDSPCRRSSPGPWPWNRTIKSVPSSEDGCLSVQTTTWRPMRRSKIVCKNGLHSRLQLPAATQFVSRRKEISPKRPSKFAQYGRPLKPQAKRLGNRPAKMLYGNADTSGCCVVRCATPPARRLTRPAHPPTPVPATPLEALDHYAASSGREISAFMKVTALPTRKTRSSVNSQPSHPPRADA